MYYTNSRDLLEDPNLQRHYTKLKAEFIRQTRKNPLSLSEVRGKRILDVAAGCGRQAHLFKEEGAEVVTLERCMIRARDCADYDLFSVQGSGLELPFADDSFDLVNCTLWMHCLNPTQRKQALEHMLRVAPQAIITDYTNTTHNEYSHVANMLEEDERDQDPKHYISYLIFISTGGVDSVCDQQNVLGTQSCNGDTIKSVHITRKI